MKRNQPASDHSCLAVPERLAGDTVLWNGHTCNSVQLLSLTPFGDGYAQQKCHCFTNQCSSPRIRGHENQKKRPRPGTEVKMREIGTREIQAYVKTRSGDELGRDHGHQTETQRSWTSKRNTKFSFFSRKEKYPNTSCPPRKNIIPRLFMISQ